MVWFLGNYPETFSGKGSQMRKLPSYRRTANGCARVTINERDYSLGRHGTKASKARYDQIIAEYLASGRSKNFGLSVSDQTLAELMVEYLDHCKSWYPKGPNSETLRIKSVLSELKALYLSLPVVEFGPRQFEAVRERLLDPTRKLSRNYINAQMKRLKRMFKWAAQKEVITWEAYYRLKEIPGLQRSRTRAKETEPVQPVDETLVAATLKLCSPVVADMIKVQLLTGMRPHEVCDLTPGMIDRSGECWVATLPQHKTAWRGKKREVQIGPKAQSILLPYLLRDPDANLFSPAESEAKRRATLGENRTTPESQGNRPGYSKRIREKRKPGRSPGTAYSPASYRRAINYACKRGKLKPWSPNQLRHLAATKIRKDFGLDVAAAILGHSKMDVTQVYAENDRRKAADVVRKIG